MFVPLLLLWLYICSVLSGFGKTLPWGEQRNLVCVCVHCWQGQGSFLWISLAVYWPHGVLKQLETPGCKKYNSWPAAAIFLPSLAKTKSTRQKHAFKIPHMGGTGWKEYFMQMQRLLGLYLRTEKKKKMILLCLSVHFVGSHFEDKDMELSVVLEWGASWEVCGCVLFHLPKRFWSLEANKLMEGCTVLGKRPLKSSEFQNKVLKYTLRKYNSVSNSHHESFVDSNWTGKHSKKLKSSLYFVYILTFGECPIFFLRFYFTFKHLFYI